MVVFVNFAIPLCVGQNPGIALLDRQERLEKHVSDVFTL
jgi:hypothetical protein